VLSSGGRDVMMNNIPLEKFAALKIPDPERSRRESL
jgi:hypothetical protein